jgi:hypothetical protein
MIMLAKATSNNLWFGCDRSAIPVTKRDCKAMVEMDLSTMTLVTYLEKGMFPKENQVIPYFPTFTYTTSLPYLAPFLWIGCLGKVQ